LDRSASNLFEVKFLFKQGLSSRFKRRAKGGTDRCTARRGEDRVFPIAINKNRWAIPTVGISIPILWLNIKWLSP